MSGSSAGTKSSTTSSTATKYPWSEYVPTETSTDLDTLTSALSSKVSGDTGLSAAEKSYYSQQAMDTINKQYSGAEKSLDDQLARSGTGSGSGAALEAKSDLNRSEAAAKSGTYGTVMGYDITQKNTNTSNLLKALGIPGSPSTSGSNSTTTEKSTPSSGMS